MVKHVKRDPLQIIEEMFKCLEEGRPFSINELSKETGIHNITIKRYVRLIQRIRAQPEMEVIKTSHSVILRFKMGTDTKRFKIKDVR